mgnify:CR=1 FL=1
MIIMYFRRHQTPAVFLTLLFTLLVFAACNKANILSSLSKTESSDAMLIPASNKPNIVIILGDDIGYDAIAINGNQSFETPNIDRMANDGMNFTQCYGSPLCSPSRTAFVSGKYNFRNYNEWGVYDLSSKTFANLAKDAGYATFVAGKWQFDGGDSAVHTMGFDDYSLWDAIKAGAPGRHYKDPKIYENGAFLSSAKTDGQYGDDIFTRRALRFIKQNRNKQFFVFFPITLCHDPYSPTPDDPAFAGWNSRNPSDVSWFPSMMKYMDKKVGEIMDSLKTWNLYNNTIVMFAGDNGTPHGIWYKYNGVLREGGKSLTSERGTHVPLMVTWPAKIAAGSVSRNLVEFQDFFPTVADAVGVSIMGQYGTMDGTSFYPQLTGASYKPRDWVFNHYQPNTNKGNDQLRRWINDTTYKLYDSTDKFYNIYLDPEEEHPIKRSQMTDAEKSLKQRFSDIMDSLKLP